MEGIEKYDEWVESANEYLTMIADDKESNAQFEQLFFHADALIKKVGEPFGLIEELFTILKKDMQRLKITHEIIDATVLV